jgi:DNA-binding protein HU-beta
MSKADFIDRVAEKAELTRAAAARAVEAIFDTAGGAIAEAVHAAGTFSIPGFGKFTKKTRAPRTGRNPRTGAVINIPERASVSFTAGKGLKTGASTSRRKKAAAGAKGGAATARKTTGATKKTASKSTTATKKAPVKKAAPAKAATKSTGGGATKTAAKKRTTADTARKSPAKSAGSTAKKAGGATKKTGGAAKKTGGRGR